MIFCCIVSCHVDVFSVVCYFDFDIPKVYYCSQLKTNHNILKCHKVMARNGFIKILLIAHSSVATLVANSVLAAIY